MNLGDKKPYKISYLKIKFIFLHSRNYSRKKLEVQSIIDPFFTEGYEKERESWKIDVYKMAFCHFLP